MFRCPQVFINKVPPLEAPLLLRGLKGGFHNGKEMCEPVIVTIC